MHMYIRGTMFKLLFIFEYFLKIFTVIFVYSIFHFFASSPPQRLTLPPSTHIFCYIFVHFRFRCMCLLLLLFFIYFVSFFAGERIRAKQKACPELLTTHLPTPLSFLFIFFSLFYPDTRYAHLGVFITGDGWCGDGFCEKETAGWLTGRLALNPAARTRPKSSSCLSFFSIFHFLLIQPGPPPPPTHRKWSFSFVARKKAEKGKL